jgi:hypothetical protein
VAEKGWSRGGKSARSQRYPPANHLVGHDSSYGNRGGRARMEKNPPRARHGEHTQLVTMGDIPSLERFRAQPIWEMSV